MNDPVPQSVTTLDQHRAANFSRHVILHTILVIKQVVNSFSSILKCDGYISSDELKIILKGLQVYQYSNPKFNLPSALKAIRFFG